MNTEKVIEELSRKYPGKKIMKNEEENPTEIICEIEPTAEHPEESIAVAVIDKSKPHYHRKTREIYEVIRGNLTVNKNGQDFHLGEGERLIIVPGEVHFATGNETWVKAYSAPGWTLEDHISID
jgi:quercetin dioxygenase-like cupin family protein